MSNEIKCNAEELDVHFYVPLICKTRTIKIKIMNKTKQTAVDIIEYQYEVKCRKCNKLTIMYFGTNNTTTKKNFLLWVREHVSFPIQKQCTCKNNMILIHDIVGYVQNF
jgi:hypothetical protein